MIVGFISEIMETKRKQHYVFQVLKVKNYQLRILYLAKIFFRNEGEIMTFSDEGKLRDFFTSRLFLKKRIL